MRLDVCSVGVVVQVETKIVVLTLATCFVDSQNPGKPAWEWLAKLRRKHRTPDIMEATIIPAVLLVRANKPNSTNMRKVVDKKNDRMLMPFVQRAMRNSKFMLARRKESASILLLAKGPLPANRIEVVALCDVRRQVILKQKVSKENMW